MNNSFLIRTLKKTSTFKFSRGGLQSGNPFLRCASELAQVSGLVYNLTKDLLFKEVKGCHKMLQRSIKK